MKKRLVLCIRILVSALMMSTGVAQAQTQDQTGNLSRSVSPRSARVFLHQLAQPRSARRAGLSLMPTSSHMSISAPRFVFAPMVAAANLTVLGSGTVGRLTKWTGLTSNNSFIGNSTIFEDKNGLVGIGTDTPTSRLTVAGLIESTISGFKFPDGTVQTTSAGGALFDVAHDATLTGNGTIGSPLGVSIPLILSGSARPHGLIQATNIAGSGIGVEANGGPGGPGILGRGGVGEGISGDGVLAFGGPSNLIKGGAGVSARGGFSDGGDGGDGVQARGGGSSDGGGSNGGGPGVKATGGDGFGGGSFGGIGVIATGGLSVDNVGGVGILATGGNGTVVGRAGSFNGEVEISGALNVTGTKNFKIDHPLDPENKYLYHAAVESSEVLNVYSGNVITDGRGDATVILPDWFEALNRDFRYQLTVIGAFAQAIIHSEIKDNRFTISTNVPNVKVSWQVTGVRSDRAMLKQPFRSEEIKPQSERGTYLNPTAFGKPEERGVEWARHPEMMQQIKETRETTRQRAQR